MELNRVINKQTANTELEFYNAKIIQIMPIAGNLKLTALYDDVSEEYPLELPIVCAALVEYQDGTRAIRLLDTDEMGEVDLAGNRIKWEWVK